MAFDDIIRTGVALADSLTGSLQGTCVHEAWTGQDISGAKTYAAPVNRQALVERKQRRMISSTGQEILSVAKIDFLRPIAPNGAAGRVEPVDSRDRITLPDGTTGPIVNVEALLDPDTDRGYFTTVYLGA